MQLQRLRNLFAILPVALATSLLVSTPLVAAESAPAKATAKTRRPITEKDLLKFQWAGDAQLAPDGSRLAFVRVQVDEKKDTYTTAIWVVSTRTGEAQQLTAGPRDRAPRWSPDGRHLAFLRSPEKDGKPAPPQIYLLPLSGGEAQAFTDLPKGAGTPVWSPDSRRIAFTSSTNQKDLDEKKADKTEEKNSDVRVIKQAIYRFDNSGYLELDRPDHLWVASVPEQPVVAPAAPQQITADEFDVASPIWSADSRQLYFLSDHTRESYYTPDNNDIYRVAASGGKSERVVDIDGPIFGNLSLSPDGKQLAFLGYLNGKPERSYNQPDLFVVNPGSPLGPLNLSANYDFDVAAGIGGDQRTPRAANSSRPFWSADGRAITIATTERGRANLKRFFLDGAAPVDVTTGNHSIDEYTATPDGRQVAVLASRPTSIGELYLLEAGGNLKPLTRLNGDLLVGLALSEPEEVSYESFDGKPIQGWIFKPPGFDPKQKYPLILNIHGGPHIAWGYTFFHEVQWMAAKGYVVLYTNPRGSTSYGQEFGNIIQYNYPGDDYKDLMSGVDVLLARGYIDPKRMGVTGGSGGGLLTNWIVGQTDRFAAAVSQRSIADWSSWWYTVDFTLFRPTWFRGAPFEQTDDFRRRSPLTYVQNIKTPLMFIEGEADFRTPPTSGGEQLFRALKYLKRPTVLVQFPGESHELSRSGKPSHRIERLQHIVGWFDRYLLGAAKPEYDLPRPGPVDIRTP